MEVDEGFETFSDHMASSVRKLIKMPYWNAKLTSSLKGGTAFHLLQ